MVSEPQPIPVGQEPPPMHVCSPRLLGEGPGVRVNGSTPAHRSNGKAKGKPARRNGDRFAVLNAFVDFTMRGLTRAEVSVWLALFRDTKPDGLARTGQTDLARRAGVNCKTVKRAVAALLKAGLLTVVYRGSLRRGPSTYRVWSLTRQEVTPASSPPSDKGHCAPSKMDISRPEPGCHQIPR